MSSPAYNPLKVFKLGDPELTQRTGIVSFTGQVQDYQTLKAQYAGVGFKDPEFPHNDASIGKIGFDSANKSVKEDVKPIVWLRAKDALKNYTIASSVCCVYPKDDYEVKFSFDGCSRFDVNQGTIGDCFFVSSLAALSTIPAAFEWTVPSDNTDGEDCGIYHFRMWNKGCWVDIVVDDYIPFSDHGNHLQVYGSAFVPQEGNKVEIWTQMAEKAYAKLRGSYQALAGGGFDIQALQQLTGGFTEGYNLRRREQPRDLFEKIQSAFINQKDNTLICLSCKSRTSNPNKDPSLDAVNLCYPHSYTVVGADIIKAQQGRQSYEMRLVRIRNPHGGNEFNGDWSDDSPFWTIALDSEKQRIKRQYGENKVEGEFWMQFTDVEQYFEQISIISLFDHEKVQPPAVFEAYEGTFDDPGDEPTGVTIDVGTLNGNWSAIIAEVIPKSDVPRFVDIFLYKGKPEYSPLYEDQIVQGLRNYPAGRPVQVPLPGGRVLNLDPGKLPRSFQPIEGTKQAANVSATSQCFGWKVLPGQYTIIPNCSSAPGLGYILRVLYVKSG